MSSENLGITVRIQLMTRTSSINAQKVLAEIRLDTLGIDQ